RRGAPFGERAAAAAGYALAQLATRLGATFIKVGQIASTRADLLPPAMIAELARLRDRVPPFPFAEVRATVEGALGRPLDALFASFDSEPVAAASVAQVHRAVLRGSGEVVAVKVRRPDVLTKIRLDRAILLAAGRALERLVPSLRLVSLHEALRTFCAAVEAQTRLSLEAAHNARFTRDFAGDPDIHFPRLVPALCTDEVLVMEFIDGVREEDLERHGLDVRRIVEAGMRCVCRMVFSHGFVHADLHPGNLRFLAPGRIVLLDLGLVGELTPEDRRTAVELFYALATGDGATVAHLFYVNAPHQAVRDYAAYEREICAYCDSVRARGLDQMQVTVEIGRIFDILRRHRIQARSHMTMVNLALMTAEGLGKRLAPELSLTAASLPYLVEALAAPDAPARAHRS
ncbi:MAG TPA: AarF/UbiB family protein, partial [Candidatus Limnocylindria bacterium]|nr:AarF/UbiB family protein [Candidatus Limnocylindria bacterium]